MPHTLHQLQELLAQQDCRPQHKWGQNFLIDLNLMRLLVQSADLKGHETILEVGCAAGSLTMLLAQKAHTVIAVEIDPQLYAIARQELADYENIQLFQKDILARKNQIDPEIATAILLSRKKTKAPFYLIANLPYQISSPLLVNLILHEDLMPDGFFVTVQAEVGDRFIAHPGQKSYGLLSILLQSTGSVHLIRKLPPSVFWPRPKVNSVMIAWQKDPKKTGQIKDKKNLKTIIDLLLRHRRKKIKKCLEKNPFEMDFTPLLQDAGIDPNQRGETLTPEQFVDLANRLDH